MAGSAILLYRTGGAPLTTAVMRVGAGRAGAAGEEAGVPPAVHPESRKTRIAERTPPRQREGVVPIEERGPAMLLASLGPHRLEALPVDPAGMPRPVGQTHAATLY